MATAKLTVELDGVPTAIKSLADMRNAAAQLEDELANAELGSAEFERLTAQLAKVKSGIKGVDEATDGLTVEGKIGAIGAAAAGLAGGFAAAEGAAALFGSESEELAKTMAKVQAAMAVAGGIQQLGVGLAQAQKAMSAFGLATTGALGPVAIFLAAAAAIAAAMLLMKTNTDAATKAQGAFEQAMKDQAGTLAQERIELDALATSLKATAAGTQERADKLQELQEKYPEYISNLDVEKAKTGEVAEVIDIATKAMENRIRMMAAQQVAQEAMTRQIQAELNLRRLARESGIEYEKLLRILQETGADTDNAFERLGDNLVSLDEALKRNITGWLGLGDTTRKTAREAVAEGSASFRELAVAQRDVNAALQLAHPLQEADEAAKRRAAQQNRALAASVRDLAQEERDYQATVRAYMQSEQDAAAMQDFLMRQEAEAAEAEHRREAERFEQEVRWRDEQMRQEDELRRQQEQNRKDARIETKEDMNARIEAEAAAMEARRQAYMQYAEQIVQATLTLANEVVNFLNQLDANRLAEIERQMLAEQEAIARTDQALSESAALQKELETDLANASVEQRNKVLRLMGIEKQRREELIAQKAQEQRREAQLEQEKKEIALRQFERTKAIQTAQTIINTASAVIKALAEAPFPVNLVLSVAAGVTGAFQLATIAAQQPPSLAIGGFTGPGFGSPDASGYRVAGVVHEGEHVSPKWQVQSPKYRPLIDYLEAERMKGPGYAGGGTAAAPAGAGAAMAGADMGAVVERLDTLNQRIEQLAERPAVVSVREVTAVQDNIRRVEARATV